MRPPQVAAHLKGIASVGAVNCDVHKQLCSKHGVEGFPTIKAYVPGSKEGKTYNGERWVAARRVLSAAAAAAVRELCGCLARGRTLVSCGKLCIACGC